MPWAAGYQTATIGLDEARLVALETLIESKIADLNTALQLAPLSMPAGSALAAQIVLGDPFTFPSTWPFIVCIMGGGRNNGLDMEFSLKHCGTTVTVSAFKHSLHTRIRVYIHPDAFPAADQTWASVQGQAEKRERLLARVCDWLRADVLETAAGVDMTLACKEQTETGDNLTTDGVGTYVSISKGIFDKSFGGSMGCQGAELSISSFLQ